MPCSFFWATLHAHTCFIDSGVLNASLQTSSRSSKVCYGAFLRRQTAFYMWIFARKYKVRPHTVTGTPFRQLRLQNPVSLPTLPHPARHGRGSGSASVSLVLGFSFALRFLGCFAGVGSGSGFGSIAA